MKKDHLLIFEWQSLSNLVWWKNYCNFFSDKQEGYRMTSKIIYSFGRKTTIAYFWTPKILIDWIAYEDVVYIKKRDQNRNGFYLISKQYNISFVDSVPLRPGDLFGVSNKLSSDGDRVAVGSFGAAIIYESGPQYVVIKSIRNDKCLQGNSLNLGALVGFRACNSNESAQHWRFDSSKGRFRNRKNKRRCLARNKLKQIGIAGCNVAKRKKFIYKEKNEKIVMAVNPKKAWKAMSTRVTVTFRANVKAQKWLLVRV